MAVSRELGRQSPLPRSAAVREQASKYAFPEMLVSAIRKVMKEKGLTKLPSIRDFEKMVSFCYFLAFASFRNQLAVRVRLLGCWFSAVWKTKKGKGLTKLPSISNFETVRAFVPVFCPSFFIWSSAVPNVRFVSAIREEIKEKDISKLPSIRDFGKTARLSLNFPSWEPPLRVCTPHLSDAFSEMLVGGVQNLMEEKGSTKQASMRDFEQVVTAVSFPFLHIQCAVRVLICLLRCWSAQPQRDEKQGLTKRPSIRASKSW